MRPKCCEYVTGGGGLEHRFVKSHVRTKVDSNSTINEYRWHIQPRGPRVLVCHPGAS
jgi:hypothetical protein